MFDLTLDASLNSSLEWDNKHFTSTPTKMATTNLESCASSPVSFLGPNYSALSVEDSVSERSVDETLSTADIPSFTSSFGVSHPQLNASSPNQTECSALPQPLQASTDPGSSVNVPEKPHQSSVQTEAEFSYTSSVPHLTCGVDPETGVNPSQPSVRKESARGVKLVGDNVDKTVKTRYMRADQQGHSLHYFHAYATRDRFDLSMPDEAPSVPDDPDLSKLLPSNDDKSKMKQLFALHVARILCKHMPFFSEDFGDAIPEHTEHSMSSNMSQKSEVVSLSITTLMLHCSVRVL